MTTKFHSAAQATNVAGNFKLTDNGDLAHKSTMNNLLDLFGRAGNAKGEDATLNTLFDTALQENTELAMRMLQYIRDARGGYGRKALFQQMLDTTFKRLGFQENGLVDQVLAKIAELGYFKDYLNIKDAILREYAIRKYHVVAMKSSAQMIRENAFKFAPRANDGKYKLLAPIFMHEFGFIEDHNQDRKTISPASYAAYNRFISSGSDTVEQKVTRKEWDKIVFDHVPSRAIIRHKKVFECVAQYKKWLAALEKGEAKATSGGVTVGELAALMNGKSVDLRQSNAQFDGIVKTISINANVLPIVDGSGSMTNGLNVISNTRVTFLDAATGIAVACGSANTGTFKDLYMTFDSYPAWVDTSKEKTYSEKMNKVRRACSALSTNVDASIELLLSTAIQKRVSKDEMPKYILMLSDMQFNDGSIRFGGRTAMERFKAMFAAAGYEMPKIIFWNLNTDSKSALPVTMNDAGVALVSGYNTALLNMMFSGELDMTKVMMKAIMNQKYDLKW